MNNYLLLYEHGGARLAGDGDLLNSLLDPDPLFGPMKVRVNTHSIVLPVLLKYETADGLSILAGPYASYRASMSLKFNDNLSNLMLEMELAETPEDMAEGKEIIKDAIDDNVAKFNYGVSFGLEYKMDNSFFVDARFNQGLKNLWDDDAQLDVIDVTAPKLVLRNSSFMIGVGFRF